MESPIYKLEKVVQGKEELQDFEGPLDLILFLLSKNKIEIQDIPIALILDQYLAYLDRRKEMDLEVASEFVTMAAHLMYIKTRMLLSLEDEEAKNEMDALIQSLAERQRGEAYARVRRLAELLGPMGEFGRSILTRDPEPMERGKVYEYDQQLADLVIAMQEVTDRRGQAETPPLRAFDEIVRREPYSVEQKAKEIVRRLKEGGITRFLLLFRGSRSRSGGHVYGGAGAVPQPDHPAGRTRRRLHRYLPGGPGKHRGIKHGSNGNERNRGRGRGNSVRLRGTGGGGPHRRGPGPGP